MVKPEHVPDEVVKAARQAWLESDVDAMEDWRIAIAAAINAWPHMHLHEWQRPWLGGMSGTDIILPLPEAPQGRIAKQEEVVDETVP